MSAWKDFIADAAGILSRIETHTHGGVRCDPEQAFALWAEWAAHTRAVRGTAFFAGDGTGAALAGHCSAALARGARVRTQVFADAPLLATLGEELGFEDALAAPLSWFAGESDLLVAVSGSGDAPGVVKALEAARKKGVRSVALSAMRADNACRRLADLSLWVPAHTHGLAGTCLAAILHHWLEIMEAGAR